MRNTIELQGNAVLFAKKERRAEKLGALEIENSALKSQMEKLMAEVQSLRNEVNEDKPQRGRPRKEAEAQ